MTNYQGKSVAVALLFSVFLGPVGLLYSSLWGGLLMMSISFFAACNHFYSFLVLSWLISCVLSVASAEAYNKRVTR